MEIDVVQLSLVRKYTTHSDNDFIYTSDIASKIFINELSKRNIECLGLLCLDTAYRPINYSTVSVGDIDTVNANTAELFKVALLCNASKIFIAHNHPSGILIPTSDDIIMTKNIGSISKIFHIELLDSIIVGNKNTFVSIKRMNEKSELE
ncbi:hypothetical protein FACS189460_4530 [Deltaproteobacteria bacterium]|nr:hypothetical protein FACS189460_4530 [Deltaproteobacteria bacterium]